MEVRIGVAGDGARRETLDRRSKSKWKSEEEVRVGTVGVRGGVGEGRE